MASTPKQKPLKNGESSKFNTVRKASSNAAVEGARRKGRGGNHRNPAAQRRGPSF
jgi:hypothetical protein